MENIHIYLAIRLIRTGNKCSLYDLHSNFRLTYAQAFQAVTYLIDTGIIEFDGKIFYLKENITKHQLINLYKKIRNRELTLDKDSIDFYKKTAIPSDSLYLPKLSRLDLSLIIDE